MGEKENTDFVLVRTMTSREIVSLLLGRFPAMRELICPDEDYFDLHTCVYDSFAAEVVKRVDDQDFFKSVIQFIDDIADSKDPLLSNVLIVSLLEGIAADPEVARRVSAAADETARGLLRDVERTFYGRMGA
jgi:hypothetical protein